MNLTTVIGCTALALGLAAVPARAGYVTVTWDDDAVHVLDDNFVDVSNFAVGQFLPNGIGTDGTTIWVGTFFDSTVRAFDFSGNFLYSWGGAGFGNLQGLDYMNGQIAIANGNEIQFRDALTGVLQSTITGTNIDSDIEGIDFDGTSIWAIGGDNLYAIDPATGNTVGSVPNAALDCGFSGTGIAAIGNDQLALACLDGSWFVVSSLTGGVISSGNNQLQMFGLDNFSNAPPIPEPGTLALLGIAAVGLAVSRRRKA